MLGKSYRDFDLVIHRSTDGYKAHVLGSPGGEGDTEFQMPFSEGELRNLLRQAPRGDRNLRPSPAEIVDIKSLGTRLFRAVFAGPVEACFRESFKHLAEGQGLRLRLRLNQVPELASLPWEYLYDPERGDFLCLSEETPVVRYPEQPQRNPPLRVDLPLKVLVVISNPAGTAPLDVEGEWTQIRRALAPLTARRFPTFRRRLTLERLKVPTLEALEERLDKRDCHIFHFIGHGTFDRGKGQGFLVFADGHGGARRVSGQDLGRVLHEKKISLAVLNACEGALQTETDAFSSVAQTLVRRQVSAVIAMQAEISDAAAVSFARKLYQRLAEGFPVEGALARARKTLRAARDDFEWATPVLYMRASDGRLFELPRRTGAWWFAWSSSLLLAALVLWGLFSWIEARRGRTPDDDRRDDRQPAALFSAPPDCPSPPGTDLQFVRIKPGSFLMGSHRMDEVPPHRVTITRPFCLGRYEVTERQWREVMRGDPSPAPQNDDALPVVASWDEAQLFIEKLNQRAGKALYRLPWEAEWEYAARAETTNAYNFGVDPSILYRYGNCKSPKGQDDAYDNRAPVGQFLPNPWGLYDMYGNVWEWVGDWHGLYPAGPAVDPTGPRTGSRRVRRGGGYEASTANCRSSVRKSSKPDFKSEPVGFRLVQVLDR